MNEGRRRSSCCVLFPGRCRGGGAVRPTLGAGFGSGASGTVFGSGGAGNFLTRLTTWIAIAFFLTSFALAYVAKQRSDQATALGMPQMESSQEAISVEVPTGPEPESFDSEIPEVPVE